MKTTNSIIFLTLFCAGFALEHSFAQEKFNIFKESFERHYENVAEETLRNQIFQQKLQEVEDHNARYHLGLETYQIEVNQFSDWSDEEFQEFVTGIKIPDVQPQALYNISSSELAPGVSVPGSVDWRSKGAVNRVKNQGGCGSCWAFSAVGALESHYKIKRGSLLSFSEQQLVDCSKGSCKGGWMADAFIYIAKNGGINYDKHYPYQARDGVCRYNPRNPHPTIRGYAYLTGVSENLLKETVANVGPVSVAIVVSGNFNSYKSGVYYNANCGNNVNHAVVIIGYGNENGHDYWLVRNSWGAAWGQGGYIKMARNRGNNCQIATYPSWPVL